MMEVIKMKFSIFIEGIPALIALLFLIFIFLVIIWLISKFLTYIIIGIGILIIILTLIYIIIKSI